MSTTSKSAVSKRPILGLKKKPPATPLPSDMNERLKQLQHAQAQAAVPEADSDPPHSEEGVSRNGLTPQAEGVCKTGDAEKAEKRSPHELQTGFLLAVKNRPVAVYLTSGTRLTGVLREFDQFTLLLEGADGGRVLIWKHGAASISPAREKPNA